MMDFKSSIWKSIKHQAYLLLKLSQSLLKLLVLCDLGLHLLLHPAQVLVELLELVFEHLFLY